METIVLFFFCFDVDDSVFQSLFVLINSQTLSLILFVSIHFSCVCICLLNYSPVSCLVPLFTPCIYSSVSVQSCWLFAVSHLEGCAFQRSHLLAANVIEAGSFRKRNHYKTFQRKKFMPHEE